MILKQRNVYKCTKNIYKKENEMIINLFQSDDTETVKIIRMTTVQVREK